MANQTRRKRGKPPNSTISERDTPQSQWDAFISHASEDKRFALRLENSLQSSSYSVWVDHANLRAGGPLIAELMKALERSKNILVLWSKPSSESAWVMTEWTAVVNRNHQEQRVTKTGVIPCLLDDVPLAMFLLNYVFCDFRSSYESGLSRLRAALEGQITPTPGPARWDPPDFVREIIDGQTAVLAFLSANNLSRAAELQRKLNPVVETALRESPEDHYVLALVGYHKKNEYLIRHWRELQSGKRPRDILLIEAMQLFFSSLSMRPDDPSALNGLGSVFILRGDLDAAEFYVKRALDRSKGKPWLYEAAEHDLSLIQRLKAEGGSKR